MKTLNFMLMLHSKIANLHELHLIDLHVTYCFLLDGKRYTVRLHTRKITV